MTRKCPECGLPVPACNAIAYVTMSSQHRCAGRSARALTCRGYALEAAATYYLTRPEYDPVADAKICRALRRDSPVFECNEIHF